MTKAMSNTTQGFHGFPDGKTRLTPIPSAFFSELLPAIDDLAELKITLYAFWALARSEAARPVLRGSQLLGDERLLAGLPAQGMSPQEAAEAALERAVQRGTLLRVDQKSESGPEHYYFLNSPKGRQAAEDLEAGRWQPQGSEAAASLERERPNLFVLYEQNIGPLTPMVAESIQEAERSYPARWIEEAIRIAVENNARKWRYVAAILEDWNTKGRDDREDRRDPEASRRRYTEGEFADHIEH